MSTVHDETLDVQPDAALDADPFADDDTPGLDPLPFTDRQWLLWQGCERRRDADPTRDGNDVPGLVASCLEALNRSMAWQRLDDAVRYAAMRRIDLPAVRLPDPPFRSALADQLCSEAAWFLHLETPAGSLAAHAILRWAALAEETESETVEDLVIGEAAWHAAATEAVMAGTLG